MRLTGVFRNDPIDIFLILTIPLQVMSFVALAYWYHSMDWVWLIFAPILMFLFSVQNAGANHNHYHTPIFNYRFLNTLARLGFSLTGSPKTPFNIRHGIHHATQRSFNDVSLRQMLGIKTNPFSQLVDFALYVTEATGLKYIVLLVLLRYWSVERVATLAAPNEMETATKLFQRLKSSDMLKKAYADIAVWLGFRVTLCILDWRFFFVFFIPVTYIITKIRDADNYFQHWGALDPFDEMRDSVSAYGFFWNLLTFNLGYHQEHHVKPGLHWRKLPEITKTLPSDRRFVAGSQYSNGPWSTMRVWGRARRA
ncbi:fatty acid desaturase [Hydrogenophaga soli]